MQNPRIISKSQEELVKRLEDMHVNVGDRWSMGVDHRPGAEELARMIGDIDWLFFDDSFGWKFGGDGDNGETLTYILDIIFDLRNREAAASFSAPLIEE